MQVPWRGIMHITNARSISITNGRLFFSATGARRPLTALSGCGSLPCHTNGSRDARSIMEAGGSVRSLLLPFIYDARCSDLVRVRSKAKPAASNLTWIASCPVPAYPRLSVPQAFTN